MYAIKRLQQLFLILTLSATTAYAQTSTLKGCVTDASRAPLAGVNVILMNPSDSSIVLGSITMPDGRFEVKAEASKNYILSFSMIGYKKQFKDITAIPKTVIDIDTISLAEDAKMLKGATIQGTKKSIEYEAGKTLINPNASIITSQGNILDVLNNIPGLIVNEDGSIVMNGQEGVTVQINGKTSYMTGTALLNQLKSLSATSVDQVEIISNPTAQHDASGKAGIINIKVQKRQTLGKSFMGNLNFRQAKRAYSDIWLRGAVQKEKGGYYAEYFKAYGDEGRSKKLTRRYDNDVYADPNEPKSEGQLVVPQYISSYNEDASNCVKLGGDIDLSKKVSLSTYVLGNIYRRHIPGNTNASYTINEERVDSLQNTKNHSFFRQTTLNAGIGLDYVGENKRVGNIAIDYMKYKHDESLDRYSSMHNYAQNTVRSDTLLGDLLNDIQMAALQANYSMPMAKILTFETGIKISYVDIDNSAMYRNPIDGTDIPNYGLSSKYLYTENNNAAYIQANGKTKHFGFNLGLRAENTRIDGKTCAVSAAGTDSSYKIRYTEFFPSAVLQYIQSENSIFAITYNRRISRPSYRELSPFNEMWDEYTLSKGNSKLKAELTDNFDLSYTFLRAFRVSLQASNTNHAITQCLHKLNNGGFQIYPDNMGSSRNLGMKLEAGRVVNFKWWQVGVSLSLFQIKNEWEELDYTRTLRQTTCNLGGSSQFIIGKGWSAQITGYYNSKMAFGQSVVKGFGQVSAGLQKNLWDNRATVKLMFNDIFSTKYYNVSYNSPNMTGTLRQRKDVTYVGISISCNLKSGAIKEKKGRDTTIEESKRLGESEL